MSHYTDPESFWGAVLRREAEDKARGGQLMPRAIAGEMAECCRLRGVDVLITEIEGQDTVILTLLDEDGLPKECHGGPARLVRP